MEISIQLAQQNGKDYVKYNGPINEEAEVHLTRLIETLGNNVVFNFRNVEYVNSCGVRAWINFMRELEKGRSVTFEECTPEIVMQMNMIPSFKSSASVFSVYASYHCDNCDNRQFEIFVNGKNLPVSEDAQLPPINCKKCGTKNIEMEELEDEFFAFARAS